MAKSTNGCGTSYRSIGKPDADGWRWATVWFVLLDLPIFPLQRELVRPTDYRDDLRGTTYEFDVLQSGWPRPLEVLKTYFLAWVIAIPFVVSPAVVGGWWQLTYEGRMPGDKSHAGVVGFFWSIGHLLIVWWLNDDQKKSKLSRH